MIEPASDALAERGFANFVAASRAWARASGGDEWSFPGLVCCRTPVSRRAFNQVLITDPDLAQDAAIAEGVERISGAGLKVRVRVRDVHVSQLEARLEALGLANVGGIPAMVFDGKLPGAGTTSLRIESVTDERTLGHMTAVVASAFEWEAEQLAEIFTSTLIGEPGWAGWVGYEDGTAAAASQILADDGTAGIYYVAVLDTHRRKGYGEAVTRAAIEEAHRQGCSLVTLNASPHGYPIYKRLGFRDAGQHIGYIPRDEVDAA